MSGKIVGIFIVVAALIFGAVVYYYQEYGYYEPVSANGTDDVVLTSLVSGAPEPILYEDFRAIDANSSPIRYRACFTTAQSIPMLTETYEPYERAEPLVGPSWFDCFDAEAIGTALERGEALAFLGQENVQYGIDRVVAIFPDGRGYAWHQINHCGEVVFDGRPVPEGCPPKEGVPMESDAPQAQEQEAD
ncbi:DUF6446 family protein [Rhodalgimonas zhirmunskyi]|uniref:DUF6446 family protein n=1 Tax=Rhodalgimonas zhirmunskyi TaxID=2964767 RepID=A0AAJ1U854_9RHOB|nr:DUF6446 family protein [Rhodoalgimonas zhirmunskyi]MDQ2093510.1 DUF6446 family protein [Rhodoalgimonas zhirmunskyi]